MSQSEIIKILRKNPNKFFTAKELSNLIGIGTSSTQRSLRVMLGSSNELQLGFTVHPVTNKSLRIYCLRSGE